MNIFKYSILFLVVLLASCSDTPQERFDRYYKDARLFFGRGEVEEARIHLLNAIDALPEKAGPYLLLGDILIRKEDYQQAFAAYQKATDLDPEFHEARKRLVTLLIAAGQFERADAEMLKLKAAFPEDVEVAVLEARGLKKRNNFEEALALLDGLHKKHPENELVIVSKADILLSLKRQADAEELLVASLHQDRESIPLRLAFSSLLISQGRYEEADDIVGEAVDVNQTNTALQFYHGELLLRRGKVSKAAERFEETLKQKPLDYMARDRLFDLYMLKKKVDKAREVAQALPNVDEARPFVPYFEGRISELDADYETAKNQYVKSLRLQSSFAPAFRRAGILELKLGLRRAGVEHLQSALSIDSSDIASRIALARLSFHEGQLAQASRHVDEVIALSPYHRKANTLKADIGVLQGDYEQAEVRYKALVRAFPDNPGGYIKLGLLEQRRNRKPEALDYFRKALSFDKFVMVTGRPFVSLLSSTVGVDQAIKEVKQLQQVSKKAKPEYDFLLAMLHYTKAPRQPDEPRRLLERVLKERPKLHQAYAFLASIEARSGNWPKVEQRYRQLAERLPKHIPTKYMLALSVQEQGNYKEAAKLYKEILDVETRHPYAANNLAWLMIEELKGDKEEALRLAKIAKAAQPKNSNVTDTLSWVYFRRGQYRAALAMMKEAIDLDRKQNAGEITKPKLLLRLIKIYNAMGRSREAKSAFQELSKLSAQSPTIQREIKMLKRNLGLN